MKAMVLERTADVGTSPLQLRELPIPDPGPEKSWSGSLSVGSAGRIFTSLRVSWPILPFRSFPDTKPSESSVRSAPVSASGRSVSESGSLGYSRRAASANFV